LLLGVRGTGDLVGEGSGGGSLGDVGAGDLSSEGLVVDLLGSNSTGNLLVEVVVAGGLGVLGADGLSSNAGGDGVLSALGTGNLKTEVVAVVGLSVLGTCSLGVDGLLDGGLSSLGTEDLSTNVDGVPLDLLTEVLEVGDTSKVRGGGAGAVAHWSGGILSQCQCGKGEEKSDLHHSWRGIELDFGEVVQWGWGR